MVWTTTWQCFRQLVQQSISVFSDRSSTPPVQSMHSWSHVTPLQSWLMRGQLWHCSSWSFPFYLQAAPGLPLELSVQLPRNNVLSCNEQLEGMRGTRDRRKNFCFTSVTTALEMGRGSTRPCQLQSSVLWIHLHYSWKQDALSEGAVVMNYRQSSSKYYKNV